MKKTVIKAAAVLAAVVVLGGSAFAEKKAKAKTIYVGVANDSKFAYLDDKGELAGYEIDILKAVDEALPQYEFKYEIMDLKGNLLALSSGKVDISAKQWESNEERRKNYLFSEDGYASYDKYIEVLVDNTSIKSLVDLQGKTVLSGTTIGSATGVFFEKYNKEHNLPENKKIKPFYAKQTTEEYLASLRNGTIDAGTSTKGSNRDKNAQYGNVVKLVGEPITYSQAYFLFNKNQSQLKSDFDKVLHELKTSGKLSEFAIKNLGYDYTEH